MQQGVIQKSTARTEVIGGKRYTVVSHYVGKKDFKKIICNHAFKQALADKQERS